MTSRISSGSSRAESAVESTRSQDRTVIWRRSAEAIAGGDSPRSPTGVARPSAAPHSEQNRAPAGFWASQAAQATPARIAAPQAPQNRPPERIGAWHAAHCMPPSPSLL